MFISEAGPERRRLGRGSGGWSGRSWSTRTRWRRVARMRASRRRRRRPHVRASESERRTPTRRRRRSGLRPPRCVCVSDVDLGLGLLVWNAALVAVGKRKRKLHRLSLLSLSQSVVSLCLLLPRTLAGEGTGPGLHYSLSHSLSVALTRGGGALGRRRVRRHWGATWHDWATRCAANRRPSMMPPLSRTKRCISPLSWKPSSHSCRSTLTLTLTLTAPLAPLPAVGRSLRTTT